MPREVLQEPQIPFTNGSVFICVNLWFNKEQEKCSLAREVEHAHPA